MEYIIKGAVKAHLKKNKVRIATATYEALDKEMEALLDKASMRVRKNKRQTVMPQDL
jgi:histone H3/H4